MVYKFFDKKTRGSGVTMLANKCAIKSISQNELLENLKREECIQHSKTIFGLQI